MTQCEGLSTCARHAMGTLETMSGSPSPTLAQVGERLRSGDPPGSDQLGLCRLSQSCCPLPGCLPLSASTTLYSSRIRDPSEAGLGLVSSKPRRYFWSVADPWRPFFHFCGPSWPLCAFPSVGSLSPDCTQLLDHSGSAWKFTPFQSGL